MTRSPASETDSVPASGDSQNVFVPLRRLRGTFFAPLAVQRALLHCFQRRRERSRWVELGSFNQDRRPSAATSQASLFYPANGTTFWEVSLSGQKRLSPLAGTESVSIARQRFFCDRAGR